MRFLRGAAIMMTVACAFSLPVAAQEASGDAPGTLSFRRGRYNVSGTVREFGTNRPLERVPSPRPSPVPMAISPSAMSEAARISLKSEPQATKSSGRSWTSPVGPLWVSSLHFARRVIRTACPWAIEFPSGNS